MADPRRDNHARIYAEWHRAASERDGAALIALYTDNAITKPLRGSRDRIDRGEFYSEIDIISDIVCSRD